MSGVQQIKCRKNYTYSFSFGFKIFNFIKNPKNLLKLGEAAAIEVGAAAAAPETGGARSPRPDCRWNQAGGSDAATSNRLQ